MFRGVGEAAGLLDDVVVRAIEFVGCLAGIAVGFDLKHHGAVASNHGLFDGEGRFVAFECLSVGAHDFSFHHLIGVGVDGEGGQLDGFSSHGGDVAGPVVGHRGAVGYAVLEGEGGDGVRTHVGDVG